MHELAAIFLATFVAEDLTAIGAGLLARRGDVSLLPAIVACAAGIYLGDLALWVVGRLAGSRVVRASTRHLAHRLDRTLPAAIVGSRLLPGSRLPLYLAAGAMGVPLRRFSGWTLVAVVIWTPAVVLLSASFGEPLVRSLTGALGSAALAIGAAAVLLLVAQRLALPRLRPALARIGRWEFWPMWVFYAPVALWTVWLAIRHGGYTTITAANPGITDGGVVGESKFDILRLLPARWTLPSVKIHPGPLPDRLRTLRVEMLRLGLSWPVILKPDVGQRGTGVRLVRSLAAARDYLARFSGTIVAQRYHPGPYEAGIFYYRLPHEPRGRVLSITDKHFPSVTGDGRSTLEELVTRHDRYRMQASTFLARLGGRRVLVPAANERVQLALAGNHAQGTLFRDGRHLLTPALEDRIDRIARAYPGFFIGRFDVRYRDAAAFMAGRDLAIVELNGATAESTDIYDPDGTLWAAYRRLFLQWRLVFEIGAANRAAGSRVTTPGRLLSLLREHLTSASPFPVAD